MVTGPSFNKLTLISAPNTPFSTFPIPFSRRRCEKYSYSLLAISGNADDVNEGLLPFLQSAQSVNC